METKQISLTLPAENDMMMVVRLTTSAVISRSALPLDAADDLKMAVEEAACCLIRFSKSASVRLEYAVDEEELRVALFCDCAEPCWQIQAPDELYTIRSILASMTDRIRLSGSKNGLTSIELAKRIR